MKISAAEFEEYLNGGKKHSLYKETVKEYDKLRIHADGIFPKEKIGERRPSETDEILLYREKNYEAVSKSPLGKVIGSLSKIRRSPDYAILFPEKPNPRIIEAESLKTYTENIPGYGSITDWAFSLLLKKNAIDSNAVCLVVPLEAAAENEYYKPLPMVFNSHNVYKYDERMQYAVLKSEGYDRVYYVDDVEVQVFEKVNDNWVQILYQAVPFGIMPAYRLRAERNMEKDGQVINKSRLEAMATYLNLMAADHSDLQGSKVQHLYPLFWYYQNGACAPCNGTGSLLPDTPLNTTNSPCSCKECHGTGKIKFSPFAHLRLDAAELGKQQIPAPPAGYVQRDTEVLKLQQDSVNLNKFEALAAVNMQFLDQTPLNISGKAKEVDREELNNFVYNFAEDLSWSIDRTIFFMCEWRYSFLIPDVAARKALLPQIPVPQNFDLLPSEYLMKEVTDARNAKANPYLIATLEKELAVKKFYNDPALASKINLYFELDPLPGISVDDKMSMKSNGAITQEDFVISSYMAQFIKRALVENKDFAKVPYKEQMATLTAYAQEKIKANDAAGAVADELKQQIMQEQRTSQQGAAAA